MKQLLLMRHAKSSWDQPTSEDIKRPLNERGLKDAPEMGKRIQKYKFIPDLILSSTAKRAIETAKLIAKPLNYDEDKIELEFDIYEAGLEDLMHIIRNINDKYNRVIIVGHNPTFTGMIGFLSNGFIENLPTSGVALIDLQVQSWKQTARNCGKTNWIDFPKNN